LLGRKRQQKNVSDATALRELQHGLSQQLPHTAALLFCVNGNRTQ
jgi:hypothetical protein